jgi:hypothetical protein
MGRPKKVVQSSTAAAARAEKCGVDCASGVRERGPYLETGTSPIQTDPFFQQPPDRIHCFLTTKAALSGQDAAKWWIALDAEWEKLHTMGCFQQATAEDIRSGEVIIAFLIISQKRDGRRKARLVADGSKETSHLTALRKHAPVATRMGIYMMLVKAVADGLDISAGDISNAFINGQLSLEDTGGRPIVVMFPPEFAKLAGYRYARLRRALYGLRIAPKIWYRTLATALRTAGWKSCITPGFWVKIEESTGRRAWLAVYVDDLFLVTSDPATSKRLLGEIFRLFEGKLIPLVPSAVQGYYTLDVLGVSCYFSPNRRRSKISLENYIRKMASELCADKIRKQQNPTSDVELLHESNTKLRPGLNYNKLIGVLMWISTAVRADVHSATHTLSRFLAKPTQECYNAGLKVLNYLFWTAKEGLSYSPYQEKLFDQLYPAQVECQICLFSDASFGTADKMYSVTGTALFYRGVCIGWKTGVQTVRSYSTTESEYIGGSDTIIFGENNHFVIEFFLGEKAANSYPIYLDSETTIKIAVGEEFKPKSRHYALRYYRVMDARERLRFTTTELMRSDALTKVGASKEQRKLLLKVAEEELYRRRPTHASSASGGNVSMLR